MPFSRYQIRNEFSLADPELYKSADKDDPEALLEGVAMAGLVGVLRQLGDLAEFAAEIFHGLHEEVMVTAARGHSLLVRVQQVEADFPAIERAFLSQTGHSPFFSSSGISWHPNIQTEQNLITKGDLPRFVMDSYEECRGPPRLFLLDKFDVAGAGACLKRYTDPSFYKVEASSFEMMSAEAQRDKKIRKTKKKGSRLKNGETPEAFHTSHVKLHQLLLEERVQNVANEPARRVKLKKRDIKFPFDTETGKGYMEKLLTSPPEDKLVHEVPPMVSSPREPLLETLEDRMVDKTVSMEHVNNVNEDSSIDEKHISVNEEHQSDDDVASETDNYMDALATMESEAETDVELISKRENFSETHIEQIQSQFSDSVSASASEDESSSVKNKITSFSYSDTSSSVDNMSPPRGVNSPHAYASTEIPFRPRAAAQQDSDNSAEVRDNAALPVDQGSNSSELSSNNCVDVSSCKKNEESESDLEDVHSSATDNENDISNISLVASHVKEQPAGPTFDEPELDNCSISKQELADDFLERKSVPEEAGVPYANGDDADLRDKESVSADSVDDINGDIDLSTLEGEKDLNEKNVESVILESKDLTPVFVPAESKGLEVDSGDSETEDVSGDLDENEDIKESDAKDSTEQSVISPELDSVPSANHDHSSINDLENKESSDQPVVSCDLAEFEYSGVFSTENGLVINESDAKDTIEQSVSVPSAYYDHSSINDLEKEAIEEPLVSSELDSIPSVSYDHLQHLNSIPTSSLATCDDLNENDVDENIFVSEKTGQNGAQVDMSPVESKSSNFADQNVDQLEGAPEEMPDESHIQSLQLETVDSEPDPVTHEATLEPSMVDLSELSSRDDLPGFNIEESPPLPPLPPMQWRTGKLQNTTSTSNFPSPFPPFETPPPLDQNENITNEKKSDNGYEEMESSSNELPTEPSENAEVAERIVPQPPCDTNEKKSDNGFEDTESSSNELPTEPSENAEEVAEKVAERIVPEPPSEKERPAYVFPTEREIIRPSSSLPLVDDERPNGIRPMKIQRPRTPLIDAVAAHDKSKLRKVSERAMPPIQKEEDRGTLLEQIRLKSFNLKPAVQTRPSIQGPTTNLTVAAILEKANKVRLAAAGSDDDDDSWSDDS